MKPEQIYPKFCVYSYETDVNEFITGYIHCVIYLQIRPTYD